MEAITTMERHIYRLKLDSSGRMVLPAELREELSVAAGSVLIGVLDEQGLRLMTQQEVLRQAQDYFASLAPAERVLSDELLQERRDEATRE